MKAIQATTLLLLISFSQGVRIQNRGDVTTNYPKNLDEETVTALALSEQVTDEARNQEI